MLLRCPWLRDAKVSHDCGTDNIIIQGTSTVKTMPITKKLGAQTKRPNVLVCYDFHFKILDEKEDVMFATKLDLFSIGTIKVPTHIKLISKPVHIPNLNIANLVLKKLVELVCVLVINLAIPLNIIKQHLPKMLFHLEVGEMIVDETFFQEQVQDLTIASWTITKEEQVTKIKLGTKENV
jgi:hypothetical protein